MIRAPWSTDQVDLLNRFPRTSGFHPFTCGRRNDHPEDEGILIAAPDGWHCPVGGCSYTQNWADPFMVRPDLWPEPFDRRWRQARGKE
jgi:hypothetical protein